LGFVITAERSSAAMLGAAFLATLLAPAQGWAVASKFDVRSKLPLTPALRAATDEKLGKQVCCACPARTSLRADEPVPDSCPQGTSAFPHSS
jgi:hypothetical protein